MSYLFVEGCDGSGKTFACDFIRDYLEKKDYTVVPLQFPSERWVGHTNDDRSAHGFLVDIASELVRNIPVNPRTVVLCDRSFVSTMVYQNVKWIEVFQYLPPLVLQEKFTVLRLQWPVSRLVQHMEERGDSKVGADDEYNHEELERKLKGLNARYDRAMNQLFQAWLTSPKRVLYSIRPGDHDTWGDMNASIAGMLDSYF